ncbi:hypothetical protein J4N42_21325 [Vibrio sp. SCSIO 43135]|uniref:Uncharacterized protein n=1 Tax=Vibrio paucivorans TaxID=2829489 RepID=A0A9X3CGY7_9VIBR|nr:MULTISPECIES: hypothetical protein [Vibrio]MCW8335673.1 hypothetical protein [Vibrio paucivorans]USD43139.1 hypothetical protein J4N42_21325 [Vibrio sp. SCSIO 43135]
MKLLKISFYSLLALTALFSVWLFMPAKVTLAQQVLDKSVGEPFSVIGYRTVSTDPEADTQYHYFLAGSDDKVEDLEPFLVTTDPFVRVIEFGDNKLSITSSGRIYSYHNDLWVEKDDGTIHHWYVSLQSQYVR